MVFFFDHHGYIGRSLIATRVKDKHGVYYTDVAKWRTFSSTYGDHIDHVSLLVSFGPRVSAQQIAKMSQTRLLCFWRRT